MARRTRSAAPADDRETLRLLLARSYRPGWADAGLLLDFLHEHGDSVVLLADPAHTDPRWRCAWQTRHGTLVRADPIPWRAVRAVADAALVVPPPWSDPIADVPPPAPSPGQLTLIPEDA